MRTTTTTTTTCRHGGSASLARLPRPWEIQNRKSRPWEYQYGEKHTQNWKYLFHGGPAPPLIVSFLTYWTAQFLMLPHWGDRGGLRPYIGLRVGGGLDFDLFEVLQASRRTRRQRRRAQTVLLAARSQVSASESSKYFLMYHNLGKTSGQASFRSRT